MKAGCLRITPCQITAFVFLLWLISSFHQEIATVISSLLFIISDRYSNKEFLFIQKFVQDIGSAVTDMLQHIGWYSSAVPIFFSSLLFIQQLTISFSSLLFIQQFKLLICFSSLNSWFAVGLNLLICFISNNLPQYVNNEIMHIF